jgi:acyl-CoA thioester hydrolase
VSAGPDGRPGAPAPFSFVERVRFGDLDAMGHLNNVEFLRFFETARIAYIHELVPGHPPTQRAEFGFIFAECHISYRSPAFFGDDLRTFIEPGELRRSSLRLDFRMTCEGDGRLVADGYGVLVGYDYGGGRPQPIPDELRERLMTAKAGVDASTPPREPAP